MKKIKLLFPAISIIFFLVLSAGCNKSDPSLVLPAIAGFMPASDTIGAEITINGVNFSNTLSANEVKFNGTKAQITSGSGTQLKVLVPQGTSSGPISVTADGKTATSATTFTLLGPSITGISPASGGIGYPVIISGTNFSAVLANNVVRFNSTPAVVTAASATQLSVIVPDGSTTGNITVIVKGQAINSSDIFSVTKLIVTTFAGSGSIGATDGTGAAASFEGIWGIAVDGNGNFYVSDTYNNKIRKITSAGIVTTFAGTGNQGSTDGVGTQASFTLPFGITVDKSDNIYVANTFAHTIRKISPAGVVTTIAGSGAAGSTDGAGLSATFNNPVGLVVDGSYNLYVADALSNKIRKISPSGVVSTLAGTGASGSTDGPGTTATFNAPDGISLDGNNNIYVVEASSHKIRKITPAGIVTTLAGNANSGSTDGIGTAATFNQPIGMTTDGTGNMYVADASAHKIRKITPSGLVSTVAGNGILGSIDGIGNAASFNNPIGMTFDANGNLFVVDNGSNKIRKITVQ